MKKQIITGNDAKEQLLEGARLLYEAVSTTLGPKGQNAVIEAYGEPVVTHDGVTVAKSIENVKDCSPGARVGIEMIKSSSSKTNDNVGDGTTSSTILAYHLIEGGMQKINEGKNGMMLRRELDAAAQDVLKLLPNLAEPITTEKSAIEVATISSENHDIGEQVGKMYHKLGKDAMVVVELGQKPYIEYEIVEGYTFDRGMFNPLFITDPKSQSTTMEKAPILLYNGQLGLKEVFPLLQDLFNEGKDGVVIICDDFKNDLLDWAIMKWNEFQVVGIKAPGFGEQRIELLRDIAAFTGTEVVGPQLTKKVNDLKHNDLGTCDTVVATMAETVITGGKDVTDYIKNLEAKIKNAKVDFDKSKVEKRIAKLHAKVGQIRVGGNTDMEAEERKMLVDDAVAATEAALKEGIVPGGGMTYLQLGNLLESDTDGAQLLKEALQAPFKVLMTNAGLRYGKQLEKLDGCVFGSGYDIMGDPETPVDLKEHGIIDPVLVIKQTVTNAVSVAGSALTTGVLITREEDKNDKEED